MFSFTNLLAKLSIEITVEFCSIVEVLGIDGLKKKVRTYLHYWQRATEKTLTKESFIDFS